MKTLLDPDFEQAFVKMPGLCLVLDPNFRIVAQNDAHCRATMTKRENTLGRLLFEVFPDNPKDSSAAGLSDLRRSLVTVLKTRVPDTMPLLRYAISPPRGGDFQERWWRVVNTPILDEKGFVRLILNSVEEADPPG